MSCEQKDPDKEWNKRIVDLVKQKDRIIENPRLFPREMWAVGESLYRRPRSERIIFADACLEATVMLTGVMRPEELTALENGLKRIWAERVGKLTEDDSEREEFTLAINNLMACQDARKVSCVKMVPDL